MGAERDRAARVVQVKATIYIDIHQYTKFLQVVSWNALMCTEFILRLNFLYWISKINQLRNFMKIRPVGADLFQADRHTDRHEEANSLFFQWDRA